MICVDVEKLFITPDSSIRDAIRQLDQTAKKILMVTDNGKLTGVVTDGDVRRWILKNKDISMPVNLIMNPNPIVINKEETDQAPVIMKLKRIDALPVLGDNQEVMDVLFFHELPNQKRYKAKKNHTPVIIMAGGKGSRLYPYTKIIPKPLIPVGDTPIVERIMNQLKTYGFYDFYLTVNYRKELIKAYFNEDDRYQLHFIEENTPLGTAGSLTLLKDRFNGSFFVTNCDILIDINYSKLLAYHKSCNNQLTLVTAMKNYEIPYGVITLDEKESVFSLKEKPKYELLVSTGFYVLETDILKYIPKDSCFDMPDLIRICLDHKEKIGAYPVMDSTWMDMGEFSEMKKMAEKMKL